ncbi:MAG: hypothetical protein R3C03_08925 [Pirellulaceae bacterium]
MLCYCFRRAGYGGCVGYNQYIVPANEAKVVKAQLEEVTGKYEQLQTDFQAQAAELAKTESKLKLLKIDSRLANVEITKLGKDDQGQPFMDVAFYEISGSGVPVGETREFHLLGDEIYVSSWVVQFEDNYVEDGDPLRSASLCVFKSIWGNLDGPAGGKPLDMAEGDDVVPEIYRTGDSANEFERKIWTDFWGVSNDPAKQKSSGFERAVACRIT